MDELGPEQVGKVIRWEVPDGVPGGEQYVQATRTLRGVKLIGDDRARLTGTGFEEGVVLLACDPVAGPRVQGPFYVGAHWPVDVEDAA